jgi:hypothetical protein
MLNEAELARIGQWLQAMVEDSSSPLTPEQVSLVQDCYVVDENDKWTYRNRALGRMGTT